VSFERITDSDRRHSPRFPIVTEVFYRVLNERSSRVIGVGKTLNISSTGLLFSSDHVLRHGDRVELAIGWPVQSDSQHALKLVARGRVVWFEVGHTAVEIRRYEFRACGIRGDVKRKQIVSITPDRKGGEWWTVDG
jgi:hypothetical protein